LNLKHFSKIEGFFAYGQFYFIFTLKDEGLLQDQFMNQVDYIIVGQGLAGSAVAMQLLMRNKRIVMIDAGTENTSSQIAAGLFNPITGKTMVKTWKADTLFPYLFGFYEQVEQLTGTRFFFPTPIYRPFITIEEQNEWMGKSADEAFRDYVDHVYMDHTLEGVNDRFGGIALKNCGYVSTASYIGAVRSFIKNKAVFLSLPFDSEKLQVADDHVTFGDFRASRIIFCQGAETVNNPWFGKLPITPLKGETLTIKTSWQKDFILNRGVYIVPGKVAGEMRVGSTYKVRDGSSGTTPEARVELEEKLKSLCSFPYTFLGQDWGQRPVTPDKKPVIGEHPRYKPLIIFNGLGTKGISLAPYFSDMLIRWLENDGEIDQEVNVSRFKLLY
jgi:glycine oxidase